MTWRAARSLLVLQQQLQAGAPRAAPPATPEDAWGLVGDAAHTTGDHVPHDFPGWGDDIVTAEDFPHAPELGLDSRAVCEDIRRSRDDRVKYMISQDEICSSYSTSTRDSWEWGPYNPGDPNRDRHDTHAHVSVVGDPRADDERPWATIGASAPRKDDEMYGPVVMRASEKFLTITIPPVGGTPAAPGPKSVWLNLGVDLYDRPRPKIRIWIGMADGSVRPAGAGNGEFLLESIKVLSLGLPLGARLISVQRLDDLEPMPLTFAFEVGA